MFRSSRTLGRVVAAFTQREGAVGAWATINAESGTPITIDSVNIDSVTDNAVGNFTLTFQSAWPATEYVVAGLTRVDTVNIVGTVGVFNPGAGQGALATSVQVLVLNVNANPVDEMFHVAVVGRL